MELRASSSRVAVTVMLSEGSVSGDCGSAWARVGPAQTSADPATTVDTPRRHRIISPCISERLPEGTKDRDRILRFGR